MLFLGISLFAQSGNLIGKWAGNDEKNQLGMLEFKSDSTAIMYNQGQPSPPFRFSLNTSKNPLWLDLTSSMGGMTMTIFGLVSFVSEDSIKFELFPGQTTHHPTEFNSQDNKLTSTAILLTRQK